MTFRTEAGDSDMGRMRLRLREPTGSPVSRYESTMRLKISRERRSRLASPEPDDSAGRELNGAWLVMALSLNSAISVGFDPLFQAGLYGAGRRLYQAGMNELQ